MKRDRQREKERECMPMSEMEEKKILINNKQNQLAKQNVQTIQPLSFILPTILLTKLRFLYFSYCLLPRPTKVT